MQEVNRLQKDLPDRNGSSSVAAALNWISMVFPRMWMWLALGIGALALRRSRHALALLALACTGLLVVFVTLLGYGPTPEYGLPFDPVYILLGAAALLAPGPVRKTTLPASPPDQRFAPSE